MQMPSLVNLSVAQVHADFSGSAQTNTVQLAENTALIALGPDAVAGHLNGHELLSVEVNGSYLLPVTTSNPKRVQFTLYVNEVPVFTKNVTSSTPFRLPAGFLSEVYNIGISANTRTYSVAVATSVAELSQAS
jgi:hypothetical protein